MSATAKRLFTLVFAASLVLLALAGQQVAAQMIWVGAGIAPRGDSGVSANIQFIEKDSGTEAVLDITGLPAGATTQARIQDIDEFFNQNCEGLGAVVAQLPDLIADANGRVQATKPVLRGTDPVARSTLSGHAISLSVSGRVVGCGLIMARPLGTPPRTPGETPTTGSATS